MDQSQFNELYGLLEGMASDLSNILMLLEERESTSAPDAPDTPEGSDRCIAITKKGNPCSVVPIRGTPYCMFHTVKSQRRRTA